MVSPNHSINIPGLPKMPSIDDELVDKLRYVKPTLEFFEVHEFNIGNIVSKIS